MRPKGDRSTLSRVPVQRSFNSTAQNGKITLYSIVWHIVGKTLDIVNKRTYMYFFVCLLVCLYALCSIFMFYFYAGYCVCCVFYVFVS